MIDATEPKDDIESHLTQVLCENLGLPASVALPMAERIACGLRDRNVLGALCELKDPKDRSARDAAIRRDFTGSNVRELMRRYRVGRTTIYRILQG